MPAIERTADEAEVERLRMVIRKNLPMIEAHIDRHPDVAKRMCRLVVEWAEPSIEVDPDAR